MAEIIKFPSRQKKEETKTITVSVSVSDLEDKDFELPLDDEVAYVRGMRVKKPKTREECLELCKQYLKPEDYQDVLCGIMDKEHYDALEIAYRKIIDAYFMFKI